MSSIFLIGLDNALLELTRSTYDSEDLFQRLLGDHPALLKMAGGPEGKLLLIRREQPVPDEQSGSGRWSLDHLFLDHQGVPVLVEVKQASDTRARREVVAQMLDYAANGVAYWPIDRIVDAFEQTAADAGLDPNAHLIDFLGHENVESFWRAVEANLRSGRIRMLFVADRISKELARIVEFLNEQMRPAEVLAIEVEQFTSPSGVRTMVPRLVGRTERAQAAKSVREPANTLDESEWLADLETSRGARARAGAERVVNWLKSNNVDVVVTNSEDALAAGVSRSDGKRSFVFFMRRTTARVEISLANLSYTSPYHPEGARQAILDRMRGWRSPSFKASAKLTGWPSVSLEELEQETTWEQFRNLGLEIIDALRTE